jgi:hypothetical protein
MTARPHFSLDQTRHSSSKAKKRSIKTCISLEPAAKLLSTTPHLWAIERNLSSSVRCRPRSRNTTLARGTLSWEWTFCWTNKMDSHPPISFRPLVLGTFQNLTSVSLYLSISLCVPLFPSQRRFISLYLSISLCVPLCLSQRRFISLSLSMSLCLMSNVSL